MVNCPKCGKRMGVRDSRPSNTIIGEPTIRRRRCCIKCGYAHSTVEIELDEWRRRQNAPIREAAKVKIALEEALVTVKKVLEP